MPSPGLIRRWFRPAAVLLAVAALARAGGEWASTGLLFANESEQAWTFTVSGGDLEELALGYTIDPSVEDGPQHPVRLHGKSQVTLAPGDYLELHRAGAAVAPGGPRATFHFRDEAEAMELDVILRVQDGTFELVQGKTLDLEGRFDEKAEVKDKVIRFLDAGPAGGDGSAAAESPMAAGAGSTLTRSAAMGPLVLAQRLGIPDPGERVQ